MKKFNILSIRSESETHILDRINRVKCFKPDFISCNFDGYSLQIMEKKKEKKNSESQKRRILLR